MKKCKSDYITTCEIVEENRAYGSIEDKISVVSTYVISDTSSQRILILKSTMMDS